MAVSVTAMFISQYAGKIIHKNRDSLSNSERESFNSAADHRLAELITGKLYDRIPKEIWKYVR
ncbi:hemolysin expression modulating protein (plasmid) [Shigella dysenteriae WRSd5]|uniref:Regulator n=1 Tax=Shigella dysenteriae serotype 1 (strain Sd197) TaxID=300267 RepID=Q326W4_SHIDS|nr:putative regulator [Shigella dysenteriae Sd197]ESU76835.1 hemolysin expression modulating protein [Shigella dysenteriae WRSd5]